MANTLSREHWEYRHWASIVSNLTSRTSSSVGNSREAVEKAFDEPESSSQGSLKSGFYWEVVLGIGELGLFRFEPQTLQAGRITASTDRP